MIAEERIGTGLRGLLDYVVFEKQDNTDAANESLFELQRPPEKHPNGHRINIPRITNYQPGSDGPAPGKGPRSFASLRSLSGGGVARLGGPALLLPNHASRIVEQRAAGAPSGLRRPGTGHAGGRGKTRRPVNGEIRGEFIAGTLQGTPQEMARQAAPFRAARPDIKAPVMHYSLSLQAGDGRKTAEDWKPIVESFLIRMGYPLDGAWTSFLHNDTHHQHCHVAMLRSLGDGQVWNREFSAKRAIAATAAIEKEFGLLTHDRTTKRERRRQKVEEKTFEKQLTKEGKQMSKEVIAKQIDQFIEARHGTSYTVEELRAGLANAGIQVEVTQRDGQVAGVKFQHEGIWISGSSVGDGYKAQGLLARGLSAGGEAVPASPAPAKPDQPTPEAILVPTEKDNQTAKTNQAQPVQESATSAAAAAQVRNHNQRAATLGELLARGLAMPIEALMRLVKLIIKMVNALFGRREAAAGAPAGALGRFSESTGKFQPGRLPGDGEPGRSKAIAAAASAAAAAAGDVASLSEHIQQGKPWATLIEHGAAPYKHKEGATDSYFARLRLPGGQETEVWGVDIPRALEEAGIDTGDTVNLKRIGSQAVTIQHEDADGTTTEKVVQRVMWKAQKPVQEADAAGQTQHQESKEHLAQAQAAVTELRNSRIIFLRDRAEHAAETFGPGGAEHNAAMAELAKVGFSPSDEIRYQAWCESPAAGPAEGETSADYMRRREIDHIGELMHFHDTYRMGMTDQERDQQARRLAELRAAQVERDAERQREGQ